MIEDLTDDELQRIEDIQFEDELSIFVAQLPPPSPDMERDYQTKLDYLESLHKELNLPPAPEEEECQETYVVRPAYDSRYCHTYSLTNRGKTMYQLSTPFSLNFPKHD